MLIFDIETDSLTPSKVWIVVTKDLDTNEIRKFYNVHKQGSSSSLECTNYLNSSGGLIGHNIINFDYPVLKKFLPNLRHDLFLLDTLVCSRLFNYGREGGHSLEAWGQRLGFPKIKFNDWSKLTQEMVDYCVQDVEVTHKLFNHFKDFIYSPMWKDSLELEHQSAQICQEMHENGFYFDIDKAKKVFSQVEKELNDVDDYLKHNFPPKPRLLRVVIPKATKFGTLNKAQFKWLDSSDFSPYSADCPFSLIEWEEFNPGSPKQIVERLNEAGWKPTEKTKTHLKTEREYRWCRDQNQKEELLQKLDHFKIFGWKVSETNLDTLPNDAPEHIRKLAYRLTLAGRYSTIKEWLEEYNPETHRIHGNLNHIGSWTHRMSHTKPNMANIPSKYYPKDPENPTIVEQVKLNYNDLMRSMWGVAHNKYLVGVDAEGIQLRILAHYMNDESFIKACAEGDKKKGTDVHTLNRKALGEDICKSRDDAKTFIYAWVLGAGIPKVAEILGCTRAEAEIACQNFLERFPGLKRLKEYQIPMDAAAGYFVGLDNRLVACDSEHLILAGYLQNGEVIAMKKANKIWYDKLKSEGIPFKQVDFVHDEWQTEVNRDKELALYVANVQADSIRIAGEQLQLNCPLAGSILNSHNELAIGNNWSETH